MFRERTWLDQYDKMSRNLWTFKTEINYNTCLSLLNPCLLYSWQVVLWWRSRTWPTLTMTTWSSEFLAADSRAQASREERVSFGLDSIMKMLSSPISWSSISSNFILVLQMSGTSHWISLSFSQLSTESSVREIVMNSARKPKIRTKRLKLLP